MSRRASAYPPSWKSGFARNAAESAYPGLWKGLISAWFPSLGPTGLTLRDISGRENHGTLENMDPATDWVTTERGWALDFLAASSQYVVGTAKPITAPLSVSGWFRSTSSTAVQQVFQLADGSKQAQNWRLLLRGDIGGDIVQWAAQATVFLASSSVGGYTVGKWHHVVGVEFSSANRLVYLDGVPGIQNSTSSTPTGINQFSVGAARDTTPDGYFHGMIANVALYNRALSLNEIQFLYGKPMAIVWPQAKVFPGAAAAPPAGNRRRRLILFGA